ncbi:MAG TPA: hypothetical protein VFV52_15685 [Bacilli bacterium]|nr:hypothetical protein [Bacilli bacterium]
MEPIKSTLRRVEVEEFLYRKEFLSLTEEAEENLTFAIDLQVLVQVDEVKVPVTMTFLDSCFEAQPQAWFMKITVIGYFTPDGTGDSRQLGENAFEQLFPKLRKLVADLSERVGIQPILLPDIKRTELEEREEPITYVGKYRNLYQFLHSQPEEIHTIALSIEEIESILQFRLPDSAYLYPAWWANEKQGSHSHARAWLYAGWNTFDVVLGEKISFKRN